MSQETHKPTSNPTSLDFSGNIFIFHAFDVGDDINLEKVEKLRSITTLPSHIPKYFKNYHTPLEIELPHPHESTKILSCKLHNFGAISLTYKIPFSGSLAQIRKNFNEIHNQFREQSIMDVKSIFKRIERYISKPRFFQMHTMYNVVQVDPQPDKITLQEFKDQYGALIASTLRFETEALSEAQKNEILDSSVGYFRGDLIVIDTDASFIYDPEYEEILDFFEFGNIQQLELRYFDRLLDNRLNIIYEREGRKLPVRSFLPFIGTLTSDPVGALGKLRVDISVITERLEGSIKLAGEPYFLEIYELLQEKLDLKNWRSSIDRKLGIIQDVQTVYQHKIDILREDLLSVLIIILIFIELIIGILDYLK